MTNSSLQQLACMNNKDFEHEVMIIIRVCTKNKINIVKIGQDNIGFASSE